APYFHVTITVPEELRPALRSNQRDGYSLLIKASAQAIIELARDQRFVGGTVGVLAVLHTWTQQLLYHPHVHCLVTGGGVSADSRSWCPARKGFLFPPKALAELDYLARYVFRVAITNARLVTLDDQAVTIRYKQRKSSAWLTCRITGDEFMRRFLQHVLPKGFHKIRYFGLWHPRNRDLAARARLLLLLDRPVAPPTAAASQPEAASADDNTPNPRSTEPPVCPHCHIGHLLLIRRLTPRNPMGP